jgi:hypothetical protein
MQVISFEKGVGMGAKREDELDASYVETPERREIVETATRLAKLLLERAESHKHARSPIRTHRALNRAQQVRSVIDLLALDWHEDDMADGQSGARAA